MMPYSADIYARALLRATTSVDTETAEQRTDSFIALLKRHRAEHLLPKITTHYREYARRATGRISGRIASATPLGDERRQELADTLQLLTGAVIDLDEEHDPALLAGFRARAGDFRIEASAAGALQDMRRHLIFKKQESK